MQQHFTTADIISTLLTFEEDCPLVGTVERFSVKYIFVIIVFAFTTS